MQSKMAWHNTWRGMEMASSSGVMAGYLLDRMGDSISCTLSVSLPVLVLIVSGVSNMNVDHWSHHMGRVERSPAYMLIVVGRHTGSLLPSTLMVFVMRSGMDVRRLLPRLLSLRKVEIILRDL